MGQRSGANDGDSSFDAIKSLRKTTLKNTPVLILFICKDTETQNVLFYEFI